MADKIYQIKWGTTSYDIDLPTDAAPSIASLTVAGDISEGGALLENKYVKANDLITGATACKITYDSKGLITEGADLAASDIPSLAASKITSGTFGTARIPSLAISKITNLQTTLDAKYEKPSTGIPASDLADSYIQKLPWWHSGSGQNVNDINSGTTFAYTTHGAPTNGTIVAFSCTDNNYPLQLQGNYSGEALFFRNKNGDNGTWNEWREVIHSGNIGSQSVDYANSAGSAPASDVYSWAKASSKPSYSWSEITDKPSFATVATSGSYNDLSNKPTIPTNLPVTGSCTANTYGEKRFSINFLLGANKVCYIRAGNVSTSSGTGLKSVSFSDSMIYDGKYPDVVKVIINATSGAGNDYANAFMVSSASWSGFSITKYMSEAAGFDYIAIGVYY